MSILAFHDCRPGILGGINNYSPARFERLLNYIFQSGFSFCGVDDYLSARDTKDKVLLTFDDGYESFYLNVYPILNKLSIPAIVFIPAGFIGKADSWDYTGGIFPKKHMTRQQIEEISKNGITIGSHGQTHRSLVGLTDRLLKIELSKSKEILGEITGKKVNYISYPFGRFNNMVEITSANNKYGNGFTSPSFKQSLSGFTLPRFAVYAFDTPLSVVAKLKSGPLNSLERIKGAIMNSYAGGTIVLNKFKRTQ